MPEKSLALYQQVDANDMGVVAVRVELSDNFLSRVRQGFELMENNKYISLGYHVDSSISWVTKRGRLRSIATTLRLLDHGDNMIDLTFEGLLRGSETFSTSIVTATWTPPVFCRSDLYKSHLFKFSDLNGVIVSCLDTDNEKRAEAYEVEMHAAASVDMIRCWAVEANFMVSKVQLWNELIPVRGSSFDLLLLQRSLDILMESATHDLDMSDLSAMFMKGGEWRDLFVQCFQWCDISDKSLDFLPKMNSRMSDFWVISDSLEAFKKINMKIKSIPDSNSFNWLFTHISREEYDIDFESEKIIFVGLYSSA